MIATVEIAETGTIMTEASVILVMEKRKGRISLPRRVEAIAQWTRMRRITAALLKRGIVRIQQVKAGEAEVGIVAGKLHLKFEDVNHAVFFTQFL